MRPALLLFAALQLADAATTIIGLRLGGSEISPAVRWMIGDDPISGMIACKLLGCGLAAAALLLHRPRVILRVNWVFAGIVCWNAIQLSKVI